MCRAWKFHVRAAALIIARCDCFAQKYINVKLNETCSGVGTPDWGTWTSKYCKQDKELKINGYFFYRSHPDVSNMN